MKLEDPEFFQHASRVGLASDGPEIPKIARYLARIHELSDRYSLVSAADQAQLVRRHVLDSFQYRAHLPEGSSVADIGSGNGFPGLVLAITDPGRSFHLVESSKKASFLETVATDLGLTNVRVHHERIEDLARLPEFHEKLDIVIARALGPLDVVLEYALPLLKVGGSLVGARGPEAPREVEAFQEVARLLGAGAIPLQVPYTLPGTETFHMLHYRKEGPTPAQFPRRAGMATKRPLGGKR